MKNDSKVNDSPQFQVSIGVHLKNKKLNSAPNDRYCKSIEIGIRKRSPAKPARRKKTLHKQIPITRNHSPPNHTQNVVHMSFNPQQYTIETPTSPHSCQALTQHIRNTTNSVTSTAATSAITRITTAWHHGLTTRLHSLRDSRRRPPSPSLSP